MRKILPILLSTALFFTSFSVKSYAQSVQISITEKPEVDVILTANTKTIDLTNFESDLKTELENRNIDTTNLVLQAVETTSVATSSEDVDFADAVNKWETVGAPTWKAKGDQIFSSVDGYSNYNLTDANKTWKQQWGTSGKTGWWGTGLLNPDGYDLDNIVMDFTVVQAGQLHEGACFFVTKNPDNSLNGYFFTVTMHVSCVGNTNYELRLYKFANYKLDNAFTAGMNNKLWCWPGHMSSAQIWTPGTVTTVGNTTMECLAKWQLPYSQRNNVKYHVEAKEGNILITMNGKTVADLYDDTYTEGTYGFWGNNCEQTASMYINNFAITSEKTIVKTFDNILLEPTWRDDAEHIIVNVDENIDTSFTNSTTKGEVLTRTINDDISFVQWGSESNKKVMENFIKENNDNGIFIGADNYDAAIQATADYIASKYDVEQNTEQTVLVNTSVDINVTPEKFKSNTTDVEFPNGKWIIHHDYKYFDNNEGQYENADVYLDAIPDNITFDKPGKYDIAFADEVAQTIYVHRKPVATFSAVVNEDKTVSFISNSYDLDSNINTGLGNGIVEEKWSYKKLNDTSWTEGKPNSALTAGESYVFQLQVKDNQNVWSDAASKFITLDSDIKLPPVAQFNFENSKIFVNDNLLINDTSYDPSGKNITKEEWTLKKDGKEVGIYEEPIINFSTLGTGNYSYTLKVTNSDNIVSEGYTKSFTVETDTKKPVATIDPTYSDWTDSLDINITIEDFESGLKYWRYVYTQSQDKPEDNAYGAWQTNSEESLHFDTDGEYYLHIQAVDNAGNVLDRTVGSYKITHPYTNKVTHNFGISNKTEFVTFDWGKWYNPTEQFEEKVNGFELTDNFLANYPVAGTSYGKTDRLKQPSGSIEYNFTYKPIEYTATIDYGYDEKIETKTFTVLSGFDLERPVREGYEFVGWYIGDKLIKDVNFNKDNNFTTFESFVSAMDSRISGDVTITAHWNKAEFTEKTNVFAQIASEYKVTIPKTVVLSGTSKAAQYFVKVEGDIAGYEDITVTPDDTFTLTSKNKDNQNANIEQDKVTWTVHDFDTDANGTISAPAITAGKWMGAFNFNIEFNSPDEENVNSEESIEYQTFEYPENINH